MTTTPPDGVLVGLALGGGLVDRSSHRREDAAWLDAQWRSGAAWVIRIGSDATLVDAASPGADDDAALVRPADPEAERPDLFLGVHDGRSVFVEVVDGEPEASPARQYATLRSLGLALPDFDREVIAQGTALVNWHRRHGFCPLCGGTTVSVQSGYARRCESCATIHYPRTDPAMIVLVTDGDDRALLGRQASWPQGRFSTLAGFVEPGESIEATVRREVFEEAGVRVGEVRYAGSQPWPFPGSLMIGFFADAESTSIEVDGEELAEARWFSRDDMRDAVAAGEVIVPPGISISRHLIQHWYGGPLADGAFLG